MSFKFFILFFINITLLSAVDVTKDIELIGNPSKSQFSDGEAAYSRNVWDLQVYNDKLFIGAGNSANEGPSKNSGNVELHVYNPKTLKFNKETTIYDDQIDIFKLLDDKLFIPGHDATGSWNFGNFYLRVDNQKWMMYRNIPKALHVYDLAYKDKKLFAGVGLYEGAAVGITKDLGKNWEIIKLGSSRVYSFLQIGDELFALKKFKHTSKPYFSVAQYKNKNFVPRYDISIYDMFPSTKFDIKYSRATRIISFDDKAIYLGAYKYNSHQTKPFGLYYTILKNGNLYSKRVKLKDGYIPRDIIKRDDTIYVLSSKSVKENTEIEVLEFKTDDLTKYKKLFSFEYPTFARSFELLDGAFYFGMGCDVDEGDIWKMSDIKKESGDLVVYRWKKQ
ncbi:MAG: hypothetical protein A2513_08825 [Sulfurimonas sp. RIFOXYD12_FULL_33_39]|uniref:hypothetical protein n=1 Tax=unclassified Sulfurimonas TaxID=2623549 RepID=UPI0008C6E95C|nr:MULTISPECIES: hypothetical protein [unclassified Sulfurimonas]OHE10187.1 MAG: hypothetical protein A2513_08825 [Sulfurimonas sp. RIFOXYD12_FULL_33_39]OHE14592.1 MAG: hypothetical protein A2530_01655 [Sulfurimonas sp. RIFOXYD2_FULL_34_21]DAB28311.1 MAG TPA: hypothetical protein CFH78_03180 [Sulfurimonas sp. UBA10385]